MKSPSLISQKLKHIQVIATAEILKSLQDASFKTTFINFYFNRLFECSSLQSVFYLTEMPCIPASEGNAAHLCTGAGKMATFPPSTWGVFVSAKEC